MHLIIVMIGVDHMTVAHLTDLKIKNLKPPPKPKQITLFDDPAKGGVRGLVLLHSYGDTKSWHVMHYEQGGKSRLFKLGRYPVLKLADARQAALDFLRDPKAHTEKPIAPDSFASVAEQFLKLYVDKKKLRTGKVIKQRIDKFLMPAFADRAFVAIRRKDLIAVLDKVDEAHGASMHDAVLATFRSIATFYASRDEDYHSPIGARMKRYHGKPRERTLDDDELRAFWKATATLGTFGTLTRVLLLLGQRRQKVATMKWTDISKDGIWTLAKEDDREKANVGQIRLPKMVLDLIMSQPKLHKNPFVFAGERNRKSKVFNAWGTHTVLLDRAMRKTVPNMEKFVIHDLRRSFRSRLSRIGVNSELAERMMGHVTGTPVERVYDRFPYFDEMTQAFELLANHVAQIVNPPRGGNVVSITRKRERMS
jgi:integrase